jgi:uncharacterized protein
LTATFSGLAIFIPSVLKATHPAEFCFIMTIGIIVASVFFSAGVILMLRLTRLVRKRPLAPSRARARWFERIILTLAVVGVGCLIWSTTEPYWPEVTHTEVPLDKLPAGSKPIRIVHISDTHSEDMLRLEGKLPGLIAEQKPDLICFTGDALTHKSGLRHFQKLMKELTDIAPVYAVHGNWELKNWIQGADFYGDAPVTILDNRAERVVINGQPIWLAGMHQYAPNLDRTLAEVDNTEPVVLLYHVPDIILTLPGRGVDLCLSGHTHGGQIALPFYGALTTLTSTGKRFERGLYHHEDTYLYITRGIGMEGGRTPRIRFFARPEISVIDLVPAE